MINFGIIGSSSQLKDARIQPVMGHVTTHGRQQVGLNNT